MHSFLLPFGIPFFGLIVYLIIAAERDRRRQNARIDAAAKRCQWQNRYPYKHGNVPVRRVDPLNLTGIWGGPGEGEITWVGGDWVWVPFKDRKENPHEQLELPLETSGKFFRHS